MARRAAVADVLTLGSAVTAFVGGARLARRPRVGRGERWWFHRVNALPRSWFRPVWTVMQLGSLGGVGVAAGAAAAAHRPGLARRVAVAGSLAWLGAKAVKRFVGRGRPASMVAPTRVLGREQAGLGYPSGHAAVVASMALVAAPELPPVGRRAAWTAAAAVGCARMYVGAHLPLDVAGGAALGLAVGAGSRLGLGRHPSRSTPRSCSMIRRRSRRG